MTRAPLMFPLFPPRPLSQSPAPATAPATQPAASVVPGPDHPEWGRPFAALLYSRLPLDLPRPATYPFPEDADADRRAYLRGWRDRKSTRLNSSHANISYAVF